jgi:hypothetical protein
MIVLLKKEAFDLLVRFIIFLLGGAGKLYLAPKPSMLSLALLRLSSISLSYLKTLLCLSSTPSCLVCAPCLLAELCLTINVLKLLPEVWVVGITFPVFCKLLDGIVK